MLDSPLPACLHASVVAVPPAGGLGTPSGALPGHWNTKTIFASFTKSGNPNKQCQDQCCYTVGNTCTKKYKLLVY